MSVEGAPQQVENKDNVDIGYDRESTLETAEQQLQVLLDAVEVPENVPSEMFETYRLHQVLIDLDTPDYDNKNRHIARVAEEELEYVRGNMPQRSYMVHENYMPKHEDAPQAALEEKIAA